MKELRYLEDVTTLLLNPDQCIGCKMCLQVCPQSVFEMVDKKVRIADLNGCMECGACTLNCPTQALAVTPGVGCAGYIIQTWFKGKGVAVGSCC